MNTDNYTEKLRRVVTICAGAYQGRYHTDTEILGLLFCDRAQSISRQDQMKLMLHPGVRSIFKDFYYGIEITYEPVYKWMALHKPENKDVRPTMFYIVAGDQGLYALQGDDQHPFFFVHDEFLFETTQQDIHDRCILMQKFIDCDTCSWKGDRCVHTFHTPGAVGKTFQGAQVRFNFIDTPCTFKSDETFAARCYEHILTWDDWQARRFRYWKSTLAGYTIIPPKAVSADPLHPGKTIQPSFHSLFHSLEEIRDDFSNRTKAGANTRRTINKECRKCYLGGEYGPYTGSTKKLVSKCNKWTPKYCKHGAWTKERLVSYTLERFEAALKTRSQFTLKDTWTIAQLAGIPFKIKAAQTKRNREWQICRISEEYWGQSAEAVRILVNRTARDARDLTLKFVSMTELKKFLPKVMLKHLKRASKKPIDREILALWAHASILSSGKSRTGYFSTNDHCGFTCWQPKIGAVFLANNCVRVQLCLSRREDYIDFENFEDLHDYVDGLTLFNTTHVEDDHVPSLHYSMR